MKSLIGKESQSSQVARLIEKDILSGCLPADSPLRSTRDLAVEFGVGQRVVVSALDILEDKDLIVRMPRKGVWVKASGGRRGVREVLFFAFADSVEYHPLVRAVTNMINLPGNRGKVDYFTRLISSDSGSDKRRLHAELSRLERLGYLDCAIFYTHGLERADIEKCLELPYPVIFVGDFMEGDYPDLSYSRIVPDTAGMFRFAAAYAIERNYRDVTFFSVKKYSSCPFLVAAIDAMRKEFEGAGIALCVRMVPGNDHDEILGNFHGMLEEYQRSGNRTDLMINYYIDSPRFNQLQAFPGLSYPDELDFITLNIPPFPTRIKHIRRDMAGLCSALSELIEEAHTLPERCPHLSITTGFSWENLV